MVWKPRGSAVGSYLACPWRAANDRAIAEGRITPDQAKQIGIWEETGYAPHGSIIHWVTQTGIGCVFRPHNATEKEAAEAAEHFNGSVSAAGLAYAQGNPLCYKPTKREYELARTIFKGSELAQLDAVAKASQTLASHIPKAGDGKPWIAESAWETDYCTGHIDLLSHDQEEVGDIKTTAKPPEISDVSCKPEYLAQIVLYGRFVRAKRGFIRYVDSLRGSWVYPVEVDLTTAAVRNYSDQLEAFCRFLMSDLLWQVAWPNIGAHCEKMWCPYRPSCKRAIMPPVGKFVDVRGSMQPMGVTASLTGLNFGRFRRPA
jgi:hypothetical protein